MKAESAVEDYMQGRKDSDTERKESGLEELERIQKEQGSKGIRQMHGRNKEVDVEMQSVVMI